MGLGDEIMAAGRAEQLWRRTGSQVAIVDAEGRPRWHDIWAGNPAITPEASTVMLQDYPGVRGYIDHWRDGCSIFNMNYRNTEHPGRIFVPEEYRRWARDTVPRGCVVIEPVVKRPSSMGKDWGFERWNRVATTVQTAFPVVQLGEDTARPMLDGARFIRTDHFWRAAAIIERALFVMCPEGGTHHMAGALGVPAVVVYGGFTHPQLTGYDNHLCLYANAPGSPCGNFNPCRHCTECLNAITVEMVTAAARDLVGKMVSNARRRFEQNGNLASSFYNT